MSETAQKMLSPEEIREFLLSNPDFFLEQQDLFTEINFPHETSGAVSLIERQVQVLREGQKESQTQVSQLTANANANHELLKKMQLLTLELIGASDIATLINSLDSLMREQFELDAIQLLMPEGSFQSEIGLGEMDQNEIENTLPLTRFLTPDALTQMQSDIFNLDIYVGRVPAKLSDYFSQDSLEKINSIALLKLEVTDHPGYLLLGSSEETRFQSDMATDFIDFVANVLSILLKQTLDQSQ